MHPLKNRRRGKDGKFVSKKAQAHKEDEVRQPTARLLDTTEILEMILLNLPMRDLLLASRVCRSWRELILSSLSIRRALFFDPAACGDVSYLDWRLQDRGFYSSPLCNLGLGEAPQEKGGRPVRYPSHWGRTCDDTGKYRVFVNPLLLEKFQFLSKTGVCLPEDTTELLLSEAMQRPEASWRQMNICQPPIKCLAIESDSDDDSGDWVISTVVKFPRSVGISMGWLFHDLSHLGGPCWIVGNEDWEEWKGFESLKDIVVDREVQAIDDGEGSD